MNRIRVGVERGIDRILLAAGVGAAMVMIGAPMTAKADPPPNGPPCAELDPLFCIRCTDLEQVTAPDVWRIMLEFVNWTGEPVWGVQIALNTGTMGPMFRVGEADVDVNGRPFGPGSNPPAGNLGLANNFYVDQSTTTKIVWKTKGDPILPACHEGTRQGSPWTYCGLLDPSLMGATGQECIDAILGMIPGSFQDGPPPRILVPDPETIDDGINVRDGFVMVIEGFVPCSVVSANWFFLDENGDIIQDNMASGIVNLANIGDPSPPHGGGCGGPGGLMAAAASESDGERGTGTTPNVICAPNPPFGVNTGFDPMCTWNPNWDNPRFWAENEVNGIDTYPINPIPRGKPGEGTWFGVEFGAGVWAPFINPLDNPGVTPNIFPNGGGPNPCIGDVDADGAVSMSDLLIVLENLEPKPVQDWRADVNGDRRVNMMDASIVISNIGVCGPILRPVDPTGPIVGTTNPGTATP